MLKIPCTYQVRWYQYVGIPAPSRPECWHCHVVACIEGRSPTTVASVGMYPLADKDWWEIVAGQIVPLKFYGTERMAKRRALHLALELLNGAVDAVSDELAKE